MPQFLRHEICLLPFFTGCGRNTETGITGTSVADENAASTVNSATAADAVDANSGAGGSASSCDLNAEELARIESDLKHMENSFFLDQEFTDEEDIDWDAIYESRSQEDFEPNEYKCVSGKKIGDTYRVRLERLGTYQGEDKTAHSSFFRIIRELPPYMELIFPK